MGPPSGALRECQPGRPRVPYRRMSNSVHHAQACIGSTRGQRDPRQLTEHSDDAAGIKASECHIYLHKFTVTAILLKLVQARARAHLPVE